MSFHIETQSQYRRQPKINDLVKIKDSIGIIMMVRHDDVEVYTLQNQTWLHIHVNDIIYADDATITFNNNIKE